MTMRVSLIIDGDPKGAKAAVAATEADLTRLGKVAKDTQGKLNDIKPPAQPVQQFGQAVKLTEQQLLQMQFQLQDIAVGLASGQSPFTVMMQQGSQLSQMFRSGTGVMGALKAVGGGIVSFLTNPLNVAVAVFGVAATAAAALFDAVRNGGGNDVLARQEELVKKIGDAWDGNLRKLQAYSTESRATLRFKAIALTGDLEKANRSALQELAVSGGKNTGGYQVAGISQTALMASGNAELRQVVQAFFDAVKNGKGDVMAFREQIALIGSTGADDATKSIVRTMMEQTEAAAAQQQELARNRDLVRGLSGDQTLLNQAMGKSADAIGALTGKINGLTNGAAFAAAQQGFGGVAGAPVSSLVGKNLLDLIGATEGTDFNPKTGRGRGYNETLGYGAYTGGPVDLVTMKLSEVLDLQKRMLANPANTFNSSAVGRYQITSETLRDFMPRLGLDGNTIFSPDVQDRIALAIANAAGRDVDKLRGRWASFKTIDEGLIKGAFDRDASARSGVAGGMAALEKKDTTADLKEQEDIKKRLEAQESRWGEIIADVTSKEKMRLDIIGKSARETARARMEDQLWAQARSTFGDQLEKDKALHADVAAAIRERAAAAGEAAAQEELLRRTREASAKSEEQQIRRLDEIRGVFGGMASTFAQSKQEGQSWGEALNSVLSSVANKGLSLLDKMMDGLIDGFLFGKQGTSNGGLLGGFLANLLPAAKGAAFAGGVAAFAAGGAFTNTIVDQPTFFRYGGNKLGVMGEAGKEAIMPLTGENQVRAMTGKGQGSLPLMRMGDGSLGVDMRGLRPFAAGGSFGGGASAPSLGTSGEPALNVNIHNYGNEKVEAKASKGSNGEMNIEVMVGNMVNSHIASGGADKALGGRFNVGKRVQKYG